MAETQTKQSGYNSSKKNWNLTTPAKLITLIDFKDNPVKSTKINSPKSLLALKNSGYDINELYFISYEDFKRDTPEIIPLSPSRQKKRYEFFENHRKEKLSIIIELRTNITNNTNEQNSKILSRNKEKERDKSNTDNNNQFNTTYQNVGPSSHDRKEIEKMIAKNEMDLINMVQSEIQKEIMIQETQEKQRIEREKNEKYQIEQKKKYDEEEKKRQIKQDEKMRRLDEEDLINKQREKERKEQENKKAKEEAERERIRLIEISKRQKEEEMKQKQFQEKITMISEENKNKVEERRRLFEIKEKERQKILEEKRMRSLLENLRKSQQKKESIERNQKNLDRQIEEIKVSIIEKQRHNELKKQEYEEQRQRQVIEKQMQSQIKAEEIQKVLDKNREIENQRLATYQQKQIEIKKQLDQLEQQLKEEQEKKRLKSLEKEYHIQSNLQKMEEADNEKKKEIVIRREKKDTHTKQVQVSQSRDNILKIDDRTQNHILKQEKIRLIAKQRELEREKISEEIAYKNIKADEFQSQRRLTIEQKIKVQADMQRKKEEYTQKFQNLLNNKTINDKTIRGLKEMFPNSKEIDDLISDLKNPEKRKKRSRQPRLIKNNSTSNRLHVKCNSNNHSRDFKSLDYDNNSSTLPILNESKQKEKKDKEKERYFSNTINCSCNKSNKPLTDKQITAKVNKYRLELNQELMALLAHERKEEEKRESCLAKLSTQKEKDEMDKIFGQKRSQASEKIVGKNE